MAAVALPALECMFPRDAYGGDPARPKRYGLFFWGNGYGWSGRGRPDLWTPAASGATWAPSQQLAPLGMRDGRSFVPRVSVVTGLEPKTAIPGSPGGQGDGHMRGVAVALTGDRPRSEGFFHPDHIFALNRPTLDQVIARHPMFYGASPPRFRSLELSVSNNRFHDYGTWTCVSYNSQESQNLPIRSVEALFDHLFSVRTEEAGDRAGDRALVLDAVRADAARLRARLGRADRARLEEHLSHVDELQRRLRSSARTCTVPGRPSRPGGFDGSPGDEPLLDKCEAMARLLAIALQCDMTRVFTYMFTGPASQTVFRAVGATTGLHQLCHENNWEIARRATIYAMECLRRVLTILADTPDVGGQSVLDNLVLLATSEFSAGDQHLVNEFPVLLAGGGSGALRGGVHVRDAGGNLARVHLTVLRALGLPFTEFGFNDGQTRDPIAGVLA